MVIAAAGGPGVAFAYRPFDGTDADVAQAGDFELELGPAHYLREGHADFVIAPATVLNLGVGGRTELVADFKNFISLDGSDTGLRRLHPRDSDLMVKTVLRPGILQDAIGPSVALEAGVLLPQPGRSSGFGAQANAIVSLAAPGAVIHLNESFADNRDHRFEVFSSAIVEFAPHRRVHPVAELFVDYVLDGGHEYSGLAGAVWSCSDAWVFDLAARGGRGDGKGIVEVRVGVTWTAHVWMPRGRNDGVNEGVDAH